MTNPTLLALADRCQEAAIENAESALDTSDWLYAGEAMTFAANALAVASALRASTTENPHD